MSWVTATGLALLAVWLVLAFFRYGFWRMDVRLPAAGVMPPRGRWPSVLAVVPARNEEETLPTALASLLGQDYPGPFSVIVVNDNSTDATGAVARRLAASSGGRLRAIDAAEKPPGWAGKMWAVHSGLLAAGDDGAETPRYVWLTDADIAHETDVLRRLVHVAESGRRALVSGLVRLHCRHFWERLLIPPFVYFFFMLYPPRATARPDRYPAGAAGGCMLLRSDALADIGGIESVRDAVIDDCAIARRVKDRGYGLWLGLADSSRSLRRYPDLADIRAMVERSAYAQLGYSPSALVATLAGMLFAFVLPAFYLPGFVFGDAGAHFAGLLAFGLMTATMLPVERFFGLSRAWALTLPLAAILYAAMTAASAIAHHAGRGIAWRGRRAGE